jgi:cytosine/creatinine deaminase
MKTYSWSPLKKLFKNIKISGGFVNAHAHLDRAYTVTPEMMELTKNHLHEKWKLVDEIKRSRTTEEYRRDVLLALESQRLRGVSAICSFIDIDGVVGYKAIDGAVLARKDAEAASPNNKMKIMYACQTLKGVLDRKSFELISNRIDSFDIIGSLPGADKNREAEHLDVVMKLAKAHKKMLHVHVDQLNLPDEKETELLCRKTIEHGLEGKVVAVHSISLACHSKRYREEVYRMAKDSGMMFITCPTAWIDHPRTERLMPFHNAVTPVDELLNHGLTIAIGSDNIHDIYKPYADGNMEVELRFLLESCKIYDEKQLINIATTSGLRVCGIIK